MSNHIIEWDENGEMHVYVRPTVENVTINLEVRDADDDSIEGEYEVVGYEDQ